MYRKRQVKRERDKKRKIKKMQQRLVEAGEQNPEANGLLPRLAVAIGLDLTEMGLADVLRPKRGGGKKKKKKTKGGE